jgi:hypothetical protein
MTARFDMMRQTSQRFGRVCLRPFWCGCLMLPAAVERC